MLTPTVYSVLYWTRSRLSILAVAGVPSSPSTSLSPLPYCFCCCCCCCCCCCSFLMTWRRRSMEFVLHVSCTIRLCYVEWYAAARCDRSSLFIAASRRHATLNRYKTATENTWKSHYFDASAPCIRDLIRIKPHTFWHTVSKYRIN